MSIVPVLPSSYALGAVSNAGWIRGKPTLGGPQSPNYPLGLRYNPSDIFADSPPIGEEIYLVTGYAIAYSTALDTVTAAGSYAIQSQLSLMIAGDTVTSALDEQTMVVAAGGDTVAVSGLFAADLVNPIPVTRGDRLAIELGVNPGAALAAGGQIDIGYQIAWDIAGGIFIGVDYPSTISYTLLRPAS